MSSVVVWSQMLMLELSVEFFNVNCRRQLAVVNNLRFTENVFLVLHFFQESSLREREKRITVCLLYLLFFVFFSLFGFYIRIH